MIDAETTGWRLSVVVPVYNEERNIPLLLAAVLPELEAIAPPGGEEIILVNDGSQDNTSAVLDAYAGEYPGRVVAIHLARNFGMECAISAGLDQAKGDAVVIMDADLQDDPGALRTFVEKWREGYEVVYALRTTRSEGFIRRSLFWWFYRILGWIAHVHIPVDASNFALMDRAVVDALRAMPERNRYLRGLRAWIGFRQTGVPVARRARRDGKTRLGLRGQWQLAMNAIFAFSYVPLFFFRAAGILSLAACGILILWALYSRLIVGGVVQAWASQFITTSFFGGINLLGIGIIGEYVARIHDEVKGRPNYIVHRITRLAPVDMPTSVSGCATDTEADPPNSEVDGA